MSDALAVLEFLVGLGLILFGVMVFIEAMKGWAGDHSLNERPRSTPGQLGRMGFVVNRGEVVGRKHVEPIGPEHLEAVVRLVRPDELPDVDREAWEEAKRAVERG